MSISLEIGGLRISLTEPTRARAVRWPPQDCGPFIVSDDKPADLEFNITLVQRLPEEPRGKLLHDSGQGLWKLYEREGGILIESLDPDSLRPHNLALISRDYSSGDIFTLESAPGAWDPNRVINPIVEICLLTHLARSGGLMLHAAGVDWRGEGFVFTGPSGAGKSTLAGLFAERGALLLNDERVIVARPASRPVVHGTPWCGSNPVIHHASAPLKGLYFIRHGSGDHRFRTLRPVEAVSLCVKQAFLPYWDAAAMAATLDSAGALFGRIEALEFSFLMQPGAVDRILERTGSLEENRLDKVS